MAFWGNEVEDFIQKKVRGSERRFELVQYRQNNKTVWNKRSVFVRNIFGKMTVEGFFSLLANVDWH